MTADEETRLKILTKPDFVNLKRFGYSIERALERHPEGLPTKLIAQGLMMTEDEVEECYVSIILKLRSLMGVLDEDLLN